MIRIATQTFCLKKELQRDVCATLHALHDIGFDAVEPLILFREKQLDAAKNTPAFETLPEFYSVMQRLGMAMPSAHVGAGVGLDAPAAQQIARDILMLQEKYGLQDFVLSGVFDSPETVRLWAALANEVRRLTAAGGCRILYHNHDDEFTSISHNGQTVPAMDAFLELTHGDILLELDIGWAGVAGDERAIVEKYAQNIGLLHLKDVYAQYRNGSYRRTNMPPEAFAATGEGSIATKAILSRLDSLPRFRGTLVIDQDAAGAEDMLAALKRGHDNVRAMLKELGRG